MDELLQKILISVGSTIAVASLTLIFKSVRNAVFYSGVEYEFLCERPSNGATFSCSWDINWEDYRLTFDAGDISNDMIRNVNFKNHGGKNEAIKELYPSDGFRPIFDGQLQIKLSSIIRHKPATGNRVYVLRMVFRRRRWR